MHCKLFQKEAKEDIKCGEKKGGTRHICTINGLLSYFSCTSKRNSNFIQYIAFIITHSHLANLTAYNLLNSRKNMCKTLTHNRGVGR